ncbi:MAG: hypothetical protein A2908_02370 [Candidatus Staskawiczbacteria bacterium RIFCSPLOWO2_01_FULL_38_12b]|uniref:Uncharacterized protein n=1 Tax=Candidatus Staskawiczbacteria bacterium RIFCSPLOWO2_01_FULL_38_12b TaxID=1802214 RepID=A0A1G2IAZ3_9BACT|nr:MAG: hypothetical protein A2908_02370 [Candidatus Staskawiczbacteria bacterium RIFCSPLOWO2_01_FULL_38_12b]
MLKREKKSEKCAEFKRLFDLQIKTLKSIFRNRFGNNSSGKRTYWEVMDGFLRQRDRVTEKASTMVIGENNIPFLPVYTGRRIDMVRIGGKIGFEHIYTSAWINIVDAPLEHDRCIEYYIFDIENGYSTLGKSPKDAHKILKTRLRSPLTVDEIIALCIHTNVLSSHDVWAPGSRCGYVNSVPFIKAKSFLDTGPQLDIEYQDKSDDKRGSPSCIYRLE